MTIKEIGKQHSRTGYCVQNHTIYVFWLFGDKLSYTIMSYQVIWFLFFIKLYQPSSQCPRHNIQDRKTVTFTNENNL